MSSLVVRFTARTRKQAAGSPIFDGKRPKRSSPVEEAQKDWAIILVDSPNRASNDQPVLESAPNEVGAPLEEGIPVGEPSNVNEIGDEAPTGVATAPMLPPKPTNTKPSRKRLHDRVLLSTYVPPQEMMHPLTGMVAPDPKGAREIIHRWSPFNQEESPFAHMHDLYPNYFRVPVAARAEQYTIPLALYMDKEAF